MKKSSKDPYKTIRIYESSFEQLEQICGTYSMTKTEMIEAFLNYFHQTKLDPRITSDVSTEVKKLKNQLISFIRKQEKDKLDPLVKKQDILIQKTLDFYKHFDKSQQDLSDENRKQCNILIEKQDIISTKNASEFERLFQALQILGRMVNKLVKK